MKEYLFPNPKKLKRAMISFLYRSALKYPSRFLEPKGNRNPGDHLYMLKEKRKVQLRRDKLVLGPAGWFQKA